MAKDDKKTGGGIIPPPEMPTTAAPGTEPAMPNLADIHPPCNTCKAGYFADPNSPSGVCRLNPPTTFMFPFPPQVVGGGIDMKVFSAWPTVFREQHCIAGYKPKTEATQ